MPSTDRRLELKAKDIDGSDRLTAGFVCQWVKLVSKILCHVVYCYVTVAYVCIPCSFIVISVCNQGKTLCSPCIFTALRKCTQVSNYHFIVMILSLFSYHMLSPGFS